MQQSQGLQWWPVPWIHVTRARFSHSTASTQGRMPAHCLSPGRLKPRAQPSSVTRAPMAGNHTTRSHSCTSGAKAAWCNWRTALATCGRAAMVQAGASRRNRRQAPKMRALACVPTKVRDIIPAMQAKSGSAANDCRRSWRGAIATKAIFKARTNKLELKRLGSCAKHGSYKCVRASISSNYENSFTFQATKQASEVSKGFLSKGSR